MVTAWDMMATFGAVGGLSPQDQTADPEAKRAGLPPIDSINQWDYFLGEVSEPPRTELAIGGAAGNEGGGGPKFYATQVEALIAPYNSSKPPHYSSKWKLMVGTFHEAIWTGPQYPNASSKPFSQFPWTITANCTQGCLFNLENDPNEHTDLASQHPDVVTALRSRIVALNQTTFSPLRGKADPDGCHTALTKYGGFWGPFVDIN